MITFKQYINEAKNCPEGTKYCNKCGSCVEKTCEEKAMKESADKSMDNRQQQIARKQLMINRQKLQLQMKAVQKKKNVGDSAVQTEGAAWTRKEGQNSEGGLNEKGRKSYERENPGSDLKAPQPKGGPRKRSFCARMKGMRKRQKPSNNTGDDRLSKSLRKWNC